jgi:hypothetical protein
MNGLNVGTLVAVALVAGTANSTPIAETETVVSVIDVDFWGRQRFRSEDPDTYEFTYWYGDPVRGTFRIWVENAPPANPTPFHDYQHARTYGRESAPVGNPAPASFVTSQLLSVPTGFPEGAWPYSSGAADDYVTVGDSVWSFGPSDEDWFKVWDGSTEQRGPFRSSARNGLFLTTRTPLDIIQGVGLEQEFELASPAEEGGVGSGFLRTMFQGAVRSFSFVIERLSVSKDTFVCRR